MLGTFTYGRETIRYEVRSLASRRTLGIEVHPDGSVLVRAPADCPSELIAERVRRRAAWISRQLAEFERYRPRTPARSYVSGESHLYLGRQYRLKVVPGPARVMTSRGHLIVSLPHPWAPRRIKALIHSWHLARARVLFSEVMDGSLVRFKRIERPRLIVRTMKSRWGSLSLAGSMTLNLDLVRVPRACIEYVVTHELCHLHHRDHDAAFYRHLARVMPDWAKRKERLERALL